MSRYYAEHAMGYTVDQVLSDGRRIARRTYPNGSTGEVYVLGRILLEVSYDETGHRTGMWCMGKASKAAREYGVQLQQPEDTTREGTRSMDSQVYATEGGTVTAWMGAERLDRAIASGRDLTPIDEAGARAIMHNQIAEVGRAETGEYGAWVRGIDADGMDTARLYGTYADVVKHWMAHLHD